MEINGAFPWCLIRQPENIIGLPNSVLACSFWSAKGLLLAKKPSKADHIEDWAWSAKWETGSGSTDYYVTEF